MASAAGDESLDWLIDFLDPGIASYASVQLTKLAGRGVAMTELLSVNGGPVAAAAAHA